MNKHKFYISLLIILLILIFPFIIAAITAGKDFVFGGFLINPIDGNSYLAKMYQGWSGSWKFVLPYTAEPGTGGYLNLFYIFLGHIGRWTGIDLIWIFHLARILGSCGFLIVLGIFISRVFHDEKYSWRGFILAVFGSGLGWLMVILGTFTADYWLAEAYPFLSCYTNPHFPLTLMLMLILLMLIFVDEPMKRDIWVITTSLLLSIVSPFGYVIVILVLFGDAIWEWLLRHELLPIKYIPFILGGAPVIFYQLAIVQTDPVLKLWNDQNITLSPPLWDILISLFPSILFAIIGIKLAHQFRANRYSRILMLWLVISLIMMYFPFSLQRRMSVGVYIPISLLAILVLQEWGKNHRKWSERLWIVVLCLSIPTNLIVLFTGFYGIQSKDLFIYLTKGENDAIEWIRVNTPEHALIMASPELGNIIPAHTGRRVIYGHPYETTHASEKKEELLNLFRESNNTENAIAFIQGHSIDYIFIGPRERFIGMPEWVNNFPVVYQNSDVSVYQMMNQ